MQTKIEIKPMTEKNLYSIPKDQSDRGYELIIVTSDGKDKAAITSPIIYGSGQDELLKDIKFGVDFTKEKMVESMRRKKERRNKTWYGKILNFFKVK